MWPYSVLMDLTKHHIKSPFEVVISNRLYSQLAAYSLLRFSFFTSLLHFYLLELEHFSLCGLYHFWNSSFFGHLGTEEKSCEHNTNMLI